jgi:hypothetical protein
MHTLVASFPFILLFVVYATVCLLQAACIKLSGRILRDPVVSWKHSLIFALAITILTLIGRMAIVPGGGSAVLASAFGFALYSALGGWFFNARGVTKQGQPLGFLGGVRLSALALLLVVVAGVVANGVVHIVTKAL